MAADEAEFAMATEIGDLPGGYIRTECSVAGSNVFAPFKNGEATTYLNYAASSSTVSPLELL